MPTQTTDSQLTINGIEPPISRLVVDGHVIDFTQYVNSLSDTNDTLTMTVSGGTESELITETPTQDNNTMANKLIFNGTNGIVAPTLGDITASEIEIKISNFNFIPTAARDYIFTHGEEAQLYVNSGTVFGRFGGDAVSNLGTIADFFGVATDTTPVVANLADFKCLTDGTFTLHLDGVLVSTRTVTRGSTRTADAKMRIGCRSQYGADHVNNVIEALEAGSSLSDIEILINQVTVRTYIMPSEANATVIPDTTNSQDATLYGGDGSDFEPVVPSEPVTTRRVTFDIPSEVVSLGAVNYWITNLDTRAQIYDGQIDFSTSTYEFNFDSDTSITNGMNLAITATDADGTNDSTAGVMFGTAQALVVTS